MRRTLWLAVSVLIVISGCAFSRGIKLSEDADEAHQQISDLIPVGTGIQDAEQILTESGFEIIDRGTDEEGPYVHSTMKKFKYGIQAKWIANLYHDGAQVTSISSNFGYVGP